MEEIARSSMTRERLLARLPEDGDSGRTSYRPAGGVPVLDGIDAESSERLSEAAANSETGSVLFASDEGVMLVLPPFPVERAADDDALRPGTLVELLRRERAIGVLLLRLGGYSAGFFRGETLVDAKTGQRFVKNRHRKGGQSQRRFERVRENQVRDLFDEACATAAAKLGPYEREIEHVLLGGDRRTLQAFRGRCDYFERYGARLMRRVLPVAGDPRRASLEAAPRAIWSSEVYVTHAKDSAG